ncbi:MAG: hypothetical protein WCI31_17350 [Prolixibacteraceae bacterium]
MDLDARVNSPLKDQNGDICALIKIVTSETGFSWDGDQLGIVKAETKTGEYWLYVPFGSKRLTIKHPKYGLLRDYLYPEPVEKACVYELVVSTCEKIHDQVIVSLTSNVIPEDAEIYFNNNLLKTNRYC